MSETTPRSGVASPDTVRDPDALLTVWAGEVVEEEIEELPDADDTPELPIDATVDDPISETERRQLERYAKSARIMGRDLNDSVLRVTRLA